MSDNAAAPSPVSNLPRLPTESAMTEATKNDVRQAAEKGWITSEKANEHLKRLGASPIGQPEPAASASSPEDPTSDPAFAPGKIGDFGLPNVEQIHQAIENDAGATLTPQQTLKINETVGGWMQTAQLPKEIGSGIAKLAGDHIRDMPRYDQMTESARQSHQLIEGARLQKLWGENHDTNLALAKQLVQKINEKHPDFIPFLERTGLGNNFRFIAQLGTHARRLAARNGSLP